MSGFRRLIKNSIANIINGFSNVIMGIIISPFLLSTLSIDEFSVWNLMLQVGTFFSLLGYCGQISVSRYITIAKANNSFSEENKTIKYALQICLISVIISITILLILLICYSFKDIFNDIDYKKIKNVEPSFFLVSLSFILSLIPSVFIGYFTGIERNDIPATINLFSKVIIGTGIIISSSYGIFYMSFLYFLLNLLSYFFIYLFYNKTRSSKVNFPIHKKISFTLKEYILYYFSIFVFNFSMFLITGFNSILVGKYAFNEFAFYSLAMTLTSAAISFLNAGLTPILQPIIKYSQSNQEKNITDLVYNLTIMFLLISIATIIVMPFIGHFILTLWISDEISNKTYNIFLCLLSVNLFRMIGAPLGLVYVANAKQHKIMHLPFIEGSISATLTFFLLSHYGMYAVPISMICAMIIIFLIYNFNLLKILTVNPYHREFNIIFLLMPSVMVYILYTSIHDKIIIYNSILTNIIAIILLLIILVKIIKNITNIKQLLENSY
ncbi:lipopolysaccharide biosynthesis protein [Xenorhabdus griffiniae]|uniref:lipopolysaccharide biosynthesis protein n=1 Tax=Xenorhabdus griffiniae TaxID=351672 RepID=UPI00235855E5|nr:hypothetical protein [Xenorhabdus griffiniae]MDC9603960.1 hypothetical protein [Xenorhabdus griffiniae]